MEKMYTAFLFMLHVRNVMPVLEYERPMLIREILVKDVGTILRKA